MEQFGIDAPSVETLLNMLYACLHAQDLRTLVSGCIDGRVRVWNVPQGRVSAVAHLHQDMVTALSFSSEGRYLVVGSLRGRCRSYK